MLHIDTIITKDEPCRVGSITSF